MAYAEDGTAFYVTNNTGQSLSVYMRWQNHTGDFWYVPTPTAYRIYPGQTYYFGTNAGGMAFWGLSINGTYYPQEKRQFDSAYHKGLSITDPNGKMQVSYVKYSDSFNYHNTLAKNTQTKVSIKRTK